MYSLPRNNRMQIALIGTTNSLIRAPYDDPEWLIVSHACGHLKVPRADLYMELHTPAVRNQSKTWDSQYQSWLQGHGRTTPIMLQEACPDIPLSQTFPRHAIETWAHQKGWLPAADSPDAMRPYFTSTVSWMLAWALWSGATRIGLWGINFSQTQEYRVQRPCAEYWIGLARGSGVRVDIATTSPLCKSRHVYGYDGPRRDLARDLPYPPKRIMVVQPGMDQPELPPLAPIPPEIQAMIDEEQDTYAAS